MTISEHKKLVYSNRLNMIRKNLRNCNGGNDIHQVGQFRAIAELLLGLLEKGQVPERWMDNQVRTLEDRVVEYFKKRFQIVSK